jgi:ATP-dependent Clp protease ATP-binding subunit ClpC
MLDRLTDRSRKVMGLARVEAVMLLHDRIGTEHILLGLLAEPAGVASNVLKSLGVELPAARAVVARVAAPGASAIANSQLPFSARARAVLERSIGEAHGLGHKYVGTEHLLLALLCDPESVAVRALNDLGLTSGTIRSVVLKLLGKAPDG